MFRANLVHCWYGGRGQVEPAAVLRKTKGEKGELFDENGEPSSCLRGFWSVDDVQVVNAFDIEDEDWNRIRCDAGQVQHWTQVKYTRTLSHTFVQCRHTYSSHLRPACQSWLQPSHWSCFCCLTKAKHTVCYKALFILFKEIRPWARPYVFKMSAICLPSSRPGEVEARWCDLSPPSSRHTTFTVVSTL